MITFVQDKGDRSIGSVMKAILDTMKARGMVPIISFSPVTLPKLQNNLGLVLLASRAKQVTIANSRKEFYAHIITVTMHLLPWKIRLVIN